MKKKLFLILSMVALLVCVFAISVSAVDYNIPYDDFYIDLPPYYAYFSGDNMTYEIPPALISESYSFYYSGETISYTDGTSDSIPNCIIQYTNDDDTLTEVYNMKIFKSYLESKEVVDFNSFNIWRKSIEITSNISHFFVDCVTEEIYNNMFIFPEPTVITEEDLTAKYEEGKTAGVTEYETETLPGLITAAKAEAVEDYEANTLPGLITEAVSDHKMSDEHKAELNAQLAAGEELGKQSGYLLGHSDGYDEGYADGEAENKNGAPIAIVACLAILLPLAIAALIISSKKKKKII